MNDKILRVFALYQRSQNIAATTITNRAWLLRGFSQRAEVALLQATTMQLREHLAREGVEPGTLRTERGALQAFYRFALEERYLTEDPSAALKPVRVPKALPRPFSRAQVEAMLASGSYRRTRAMIMLGYYQGFRVSQIARVRGDDIDRLAGTIRTVAKGGKLRWVPLRPEVAELALTMPTPAWWFPARDGSDRPIKGASVTDLITQAKRRAGITDPKLTPHSLRHSFGSELTEAGVDIRVVQELMLHETLQSTEIYTHVSQRRKVEGLAALTPIHAPARSGRRAA